MATNSISVQVIREDIQPTIEKLLTFDFYSGECRTLALQVLNKYNQKPYMIPTGWGVMLTLGTSDSAVPLNFEGQIDSIDKSVITTPLSTSDTNNIISGRLKTSLIYINDPDAVEIISTFTPNSYTASTGVVSIGDSVDLSNVVAGDIFKDGAGNKFIILSVSNVTGIKKVVIGKNKSLGTLVGSTIIRSTCNLISVRDAVIQRTKS